MTTIAGDGSVQYYASDDCFGACNGTIANRWDQVEMGELETPCQTQSPAFTCTIEFETNDSWLGGYQVFPDANAVETDENSPNNAYEGIDQSQDDTQSSIKRRTKGGPKGTFSPYKPIPTPTPAPRPTKNPICNDLVTTPPKAANPSSTCPL